MNVIETTEKTDSIETTNTIETTETTETLEITEKPKEKRLQEIIEILKKIEGLGIPIESEEVQELKSHFDRYLHSGICWKGTVPFRNYDRIADVVLPKKANKTIEVTLRVATKPNGHKKMKR